MNRFCPCKVMWMKWWCCCLLYILLSRQHAFLEDFLFIPRRRRLPTTTLSFFYFLLVESFVFVLPIKIVARLYVFSLQCLYEMKIFSKALNKLWNLRYFRIIRCGFLMREYNSLFPDEMSLGCHIWD